VQRISVVSIPVSDQDVAKAFYVDKLGFELVVDAAFGDGLRWLQVRPPGSEASIALVTWFDDMPAGSLHGLVIDTDHLDGDYRAMVERGVPFADPPKATDGGTFATFADPDGNHVSLRQAD
jgi:catechol 2,3-dioxygenase-like lactoylglutathione lyase family enzyme